MLLKLVQMKIPKSVKYWLLFGLVLLFLQIIIGGITRITGSGLSITKWEIITGTLPPLNEADWMDEFNLYRETPQYQKLNKGMSLSDFKFIYFWEYFHRLWARSIGLVFAIPFVVFLMKGYIDKRLRNDLLIVVFLAALTASFGWIMVASGLIDRPWVNAYKLSLHLSLAIITLGYLLWAICRVFTLDLNRTFSQSKYKISFFVFVGLLFVQLFLGGMMSGMRAGMLYPTWPLMNGEFIASEVLNFNNWTVENFVNYDSTIFMGSLVQVSHRMLAYFLFIFGVFLFYRLYKESNSTLFKKWLILFLSFLMLQVLIGILTVISSKGVVPLFYGVMHQAFGILLFSISLVVAYFIKHSLFRVDRN